MSAQMNRLRGGRAVNWRTVLGLLLVPLTAAGLLLWGLWSPTERLETVTAAVVNLDEPVMVDDQLVPLGRVLAAELIDGDAETNFTWQLTDEEDAAAGLRDGRYATVVTIPENFSAAATSTSKAMRPAAEAAATPAATAPATAPAPAPTAPAAAPAAPGAAGGLAELQTATIDIKTSERGRLLDTALSNIVTETATRVLNEQLGVQFVGGVFVGLTEIGKGIGTAADGAKQLATGSHAVADGVAALSDGMVELSSGAGSLSGGAAELASGAAGLADGARRSAEGSAQLADGVGQYTGMVNSVLNGVIDNSAQAVEPLQQLRQLVSTIPAELWPADAEMSQQQTLGTIDALLAEFSAAASGSGDSQLVQLRQAGENLAAGTRASADGQAQLATGMEQYAAGVAEFSGGMSDYAAGVAEAVPGASELAAGARKAADGTSELASGLKQTANAIPSYTKSESERLAEVATKPVHAKGASDELFNAAGVPLFAGIALWAGAFASFLVLAPLWRRTREAARGIGYLTMRSALPAAGLGALQGAIVGLILPLLLGYDLGQGFGFFGLAVLAGAAFSLVNQGLSALFGGFGRFASFALLVVAFAIGVISTAPPLLQAIGDGSPVGALFGGFQAIAMGTAGVGGAVMLLVLWALAGLGLTAFAVVRSRKRPLV